MDVMANGEGDGLTGTNVSACGTCVDACPAFFELGR